MKFTNEENQKKFLRDESYFENVQDFCLGKNLEEAGTITREILKSQNINIFNKDTEKEKE